MVTVLLFVWKNCDLTIQSVLSLVCTLYTQTHN